MHFRTEHRFAATADDIAEVLADPGFYEALELPDLAIKDVVAGAPGPERSLTLRYEFIGHLDPIARRLLGDSSLTWVQEVVVDRRNLSGSLAFHAERGPKRLYGSATFVLVEKPSPPAGVSSSPTVDRETVRKLQGELVVAVPAIGGRAERKIVPGLLRRLDLEAEALRKRLGQEGPDAQEP